MWSTVESADEGELAESPLGTIERNHNCPHVQDWADRCFSIYAKFGMPVHAISFAQRMLGFHRACDSDTAGPFSKWEQRCLDQKRRRALWKKAGDLAQVMLRAYLEYGSLRESLPKLLQISREIQPDKVASNSQQPEFRLLKMVSTVDYKIAFPVKLSRGLLTDMQA